jgi:hypothetical protein
VLAECREWSLSLADTDTTIYGGRTAGERIRARRERDRAALPGMPKLWPMCMPTAARATAFPEVRKRDFWLCHAAFSGGYVEIVTGGDAPGRW